MKTKLLTVAVNYIEFKCKLLLHSRACQIFSPVRQSPQSAAVPLRSPELPVGSHRTGPCPASQSVKGGAGL